jgi:hypothetical protein
MKFFNYLCQEMMEVAASAGEPRPQATPWGAVTLSYRSALSAVDERSRTDRGQIIVLSQRAVAKSHAARHAAGAQGALGEPAAQPNLAGRIASHIFALTTRARHGSAKPVSAPSRAFRIRFMPRSWLKTTTKTRRPLKSGTNG